MSACARGLTSRGVWKRGKAWHLARAYQSHLASQTPDRITRASVISSVSRMREIRTSGLMSGGLETRSREPKMSDRSEKRRTNHRTLKPARQPPTRQMVRASAQLMRRRARRASILHDQALGGDGSFSDAWTRQVPRQIHSDDAEHQLQARGECTGRSCIYGVVSAKTTVWGDWCVRVCSVSGVFLWFSAVLR